MSDDAAKTPGPIRRLLDRLTATTEELEAHDLLEETVHRGARPIRECCSGERVDVSGSLRAVTLRPRGGVPALEADLYDGSGTVTLVWLGRRRIGGIDPGRAVRAHGRVTMQQGRYTIFNPAYELLP